MDVVDPSFRGEQTSPGLVQRRAVTAQGKRASGFVMPMPCPRKAPVPPVTSSPQLGASVPPPSTNSGPTAQALPELPALPKAAIPPEPAPPSPPPRPSVRCASVQPAAPRPSIPPASLPSVRPPSTIPRPTRTRPAQLSSRPSSLPPARLSASVPRPSTVSKPASASPPGAAGISWGARSRAAASPPVCARQGEAADPTSEGQRDRRGG